MNFDLFLQVIHDTISRDDLELLINLWKLAINFSQIEREHLQALTNKFALKQAQKHDYSSVALSKRPFRKLVRLRDKKWLGKNWATKKCFKWLKTESLLYWVRLLVNLAVKKQSLEPLHSVCFLLCERLPLPEIKPLLDKILLLYKQNSNQAICSLFSQLLSFRGKQAHAVFFQLFEGIIYTHLEFTIRLTQEQFVELFVSATDQVRFLKAFSLAFIKLAEYDVTTVNKLLKCDTSSKKCLSQLLLESKLAMDFGIYQLDYDEELFVFLEQGLREKLTREKGKEMYWNRLLNKLLQRTFELSEKSVIINGI